MYREKRLKVYALACIGCRDYRLSRLYFRLEPWTTALESSAIVMRYFERAHVVLRRSPQLSTEVVSDCLHLLLIACLNGLRFGDASRARTPTGKQLYVSILEDRSKLSVIRLIKYIGECMPG